MKRSDRQDVGKPLSPKNESANLNVEYIPLQDNPLKGILKKQGKKGTWKLRCCFQDGNKICFCKPEEDPKKTDTSLDYINVTDIKNIAQISNVEFHILLQTDRIIPLQVLNEGICGCIFLLNLQR